ncbi:MAG TPA: DHH family phosphoesterase [bacterium]|nr:DHH family phosphoesterase [bacterium]HOD87160.1 DHH family phosphoesterase [bacterium]HQB76407.1 DHH family phosphoesterase [bacterium]HQL34503.1 DHH family phosphoesterase [bacterium]HQO11071.1 DHH family phosphoesterase [bacterium]
MLTLEQQIFKQIDKSENILIVFNADWNGDAVASALGLFLYLKKIGKKTEIAAHLAEDDAAANKAAAAWRFLPAFEKIQSSLKNLRKFIVSLDISQATINQIKYTVDGHKLNFIISPEKGWFTPEDISTSSSGFKYDLIFVLDTPDFESLGAIYDNNVEFFYKTTVINIDHQADNEEYGQINYLDLNVVSTAEMVYNLIKQHSQEPLDEDIATCLLAGIISKTKNYKSANLTPRTLLTSSKLIGLGARREEIINQLYRSKPLAVLKSWGKILNNLKTEDQGRIVWSWLEEKDEISALINGQLDVQEIFEEISASVAEAKFIFIAGVHPQSEGIFILIQAAKGFSSIEVLKNYSPAGNTRIASAILPFSREEWQEKFIAALKDKLDKNKI